MGHHRSISPWNRDYSRIWYQPHARFSISNLTPGTKYYYRVIVGNGESAGTFMTAPNAEAKDLKFFAFGDTRDGTEIHDSIDGQIIAAYTDDPAFQTFISLPGM